MWPSYLTHLACSIDPSRAGGASLEDSPWRALPRWRRLEPLSTLLELRWTFLQQFRQNFASPHLQRLVEARRRQSFAAVSPLLLKAACVHFLFREACFPWPGARRATTRSRLLTRSRAHPKQPSSPKHLLNLLLTMCTSRALRPLRRPKHSFLLPALWRRRAGLRFVRTSLRPLVDVSFRQIAEFRPHSNKLRQSTFLKFQKLLPSNRGTHSLQQRALLSSQSMRVERPL